MSRSVVSSENAPKALGPYSQAIATDGLIFLAGQLPLDPTTGNFVEGDVGEMTRQVLRNLAAVLEAADSSLDKIVKTTVFLADLNDFAAMNTAYAEFFPNDPPARSTVQVARLPRDARVEIEAIAVR
jgi:2-iminobutanoate/2-iminopropanoate deaminase